MSIMYNGLPNEFAQNELQQVEQQKGALVSIAAAQKSNANMRTPSKTVNDDFDGIILRSVLPSLRTLVEKRLVSESAEKRKKCMESFSVVAPLYTRTLIENQVDPFVQRVLLDNRPMAFHAEQAGQRNSLPVKRIHDDIKAAAAVLVRERYREPSDFDTTDLKVTQTSRKRSGSTPISKLQSMKVTGVCRATLYGLRAADWKTMIDASIVPELEAR